MAAMRFCRKYIKLSVTFLLASKHAVEGQQKNKALRVALALLFLLYLLHCVDLVSLEAEQLVDGVDP